MVGPRSSPFDARRDDTRAALLYRARAAHTDREVAHARRALRAWIETHPADTEVLLADEQMPEGQAWPLWPS